MQRVQPTSAQSRALRQIRRNGLWEQFNNLTSDMTETQRNEFAITFINQYFESRSYLREEDRQTRQRQAIDRRQRAEEAFRSDNETLVFQDDTIARLREWVEEAESELLQGEVFIVHSGDSYYTLNMSNYRQLLQHLEENVEFEEEIESDTRLILELIRTQEFEVVRYIPREMQRQMNPDRNTGSFLPWIHRVKDKELSHLLFTMGLFEEVSAKNYEMNCLVHSLKGKVPDPVVEDVMTAVRNSTVPRKHLRTIGQQYDLNFTIHTDQDHHVRSYGNSKGTKVELCLFRNHYFPFIKDTGVTGFAIKNYDELKEKFPNSWKLKKNMSGSSSKVGITSMRLMKLIIDSNLVSPIDMSNEEIWKTVYIRQISNCFNTLDYPEDAVKPVHEPRGVHENKEDFKKEIINLKKHRRKMLERGGEQRVEELDRKITAKGLGYKEQEELYRQSMIPSAIIFFDFESSSEGHHKAYMVCWQISGESEVYKATGENCAYEFLQWLSFTFEGENDDLELMLIAHNVSYDISFLLEYLEPGSLKAIKKGNRFISAEGVFKGININFKDSYKLIPSPLRLFPTMFDLSEDLGKEIMPYAVFTQEFIQGDFKIKPSKIAEIYGDDYVDSMRSNINKWLCVVHRDGDILWDMLKYSHKYCERDVELLSTGWQCFREMSLNFFDIDINSRGILTTAGMSYRHLLNECFEETYSVSGIVLEFIRQSTVGGQTQSARNQKIHVKEPIEDQDKRSLYPSAMVQMPGIPKGKPKVFAEIIPDSADYFFVEIIIKRVEGPDYDFPILTVRDSKGINNWTNNIEGSRVIIGKQTLCDLIDWNDVFEYTVIHGYYWDEGFNDKISSTIKSMYDKRDELKSQGNPAQTLYKLLMNASYGRTGLKPIDDTDVYLTPNQINRYIANNHDRIKRCNVMPNGDTRVLTAKPINRHYNQQHVASMILEYAKHLMRKVLLLQQRIGSPFAGNIYYTDTDSIHISSPAWKALQREYMETYGEELEGKQLGQFHSDFEMKGTYQIKNQQLVPTDIDESLLKGGNLISKELYVCGKKAYLDVLTSDKNPDVEMYHFRLKGISENAVIEKCNKEYNGNIQRLYQDLLNGQKVTFTLAGMFKTGYNGLIQTISQDRSVKF